MWPTHHPVLHHITVLPTTAALLIRSPACAVTSTYATIISLHCKHDRTQVDMHMFCKKDAGLRKYMIDNRLLQKRSLEFALMWSTRWTPCGSPS